ncbi:MAG TPA: RND transporter, partial [Candidatus Limnocylindrales bacterium]|nr:RND transporter [Candidatus Limnocylindrales bacterium]
MRRTLLRLASTTSLLILLTGCVVGPNYRRPAAPVAPAWREQAPWRAADPKDAIPKGTWWTIFADDELNQYMVQALKSSQT